MAAGAMSEGTLVVTGAAGFVGHALCAHLVRIDRRYRALVRAPEQAAPGASTLAVGDLAVLDEEWLRTIVAGAKAVVHLAGRAHVMREPRGNGDAPHHAANVVATQRLARAAARAGVERFVLASTVKVHGEATAPGKPFRAGDAIAPQDAYARSKAAAEEALTEACAGTAMTPIVLRLPLVYGPGVKGNFLALLDAVAREAWLPVGAIANRRDLLYVGNLVHAIVALVDRAVPPGGAWLAADGEALATPELVRRMASTLGVEPRMPALPVPLLTLGGWLTGRSAMVQRLVQSLEVDAAPLRACIGPMPYSMERGLAETAAWWRARHAI